MDQHITSENWERIFESAWTQDWPKKYLKKFIRDVRDEALQAQQQKFRETLKNIRLSTHNDSFYLNRIIEQELSQLDQSQ